MNPARHKICHSTFKIYLKNSCIYKSRRCLHYFYQYNDINFKNNFIQAHTKNLFDRENRFYSTTTTIDKLDIQPESEHDDLAAKVISGLRETQLQQENKKSVFYKSLKKAKQKSIDGPGLNYFISKQSHRINVQPENIPYINSPNGNNQKVYLEVHGCQMNVNDAEIVSAILKKSNYEITENVEDADIIFLITCAIRESAEEKIWHKLKNLRHLKKKKLVSKIGLLGCMAERLKHKIIEEEKIVDIVAGPDSYKDLPRLLSLSNEHETAINVTLSFDETYADVTPVRLNPKLKTAYVTIMRGCDNMCSYCIVPFTRGKERSRPMSSILNEIQQLSDQGVKEVTLLGQNVNSYRDVSELNFYSNGNIKTNLAKGFNTVYKTKQGGLRFSDLLSKVSLINPEMRIRFTSPHPKDFPDEVLHLIAERPNICKQLHLPAQSGSTSVLSRMRRGYSREAYLELIHHIRNIIPNVALSSDFITGFCGETEDEFNETLTLIQEVKYSLTYLFPYSMREKTTAHRRYSDDVGRKIKIERLQKMIQLYRSEVEIIYKNQIGQQQLVLVEGESKRSEKDLQGRNDGNIKVIFPNESIPENSSSSTLKPISNGDYVVVHICNANSQILRGIPLYHSSISRFFSIDDRVEAIRC